VLNLYAIHNIPPNSYKNIQKFLSRSNWQVEAFLETIVLFKKNGAPGISLAQIMHNANQIKEIENNTSINIEDDIELIGYNIKHPLKEGFLDITLYWKCLRHTSKDINIFLDITSQNDTFLMRKVLPICYRIFPTNSWKKDEIFEDRFRIAIPPTYLINKNKLKIGFFNYLTGNLCMINGPVDNWGRLFLSQID